MRRLIDANALTEFINEITREEDWVLSQYSADWIYSMLESAPTVDAVEVVHGRWKRENIIGESLFDCEPFELDIFACSVCNATFDISEALKYCPSCGAKMDGGNGDE